MDLRERLEVIAADYYTKAMAIRTTIELLMQLEGQHIKKAKKVQKRAKQYEKPKKLHWTQTKAGKAKMRKVQLLAWAKKRANKNK